MCEMSAIVQQLEYSLSLPFFGILEKEMVTQSSILAWRIPWTEKPGGVQSMGLQRVEHDFTFTFFGIGMKTDLHTQ